MVDSLRTLQWGLDGWIIAAGVLCAVASALLGPFLVLRRMSMMGDAISHAVLPGLAVAFMITDSRASVPMFIGAAVVGVLTAIFTEWIRSFGKVDEGASMGVVFTVLFAIGLLLVVQAADSVDLDPGCVLYGAIEMTPLDTMTVMSADTQQTLSRFSQLLWGHDVPREVPRVVLTLGSVCLLNLLFVIFFYKELKISSFDPSLSTALGIRSSVMHYVLMTLVAITAVASFESVGNILVVAMLVVPAAAAYMLTHRLLVMVILSVVIAILAGIFGHLSAIAVPAAFGYESANTAGMMAVATGTLFAIAVLFSPKHGIPAVIRRRKGARIEPAAV